MNVTKRYDLNENLQIIFLQCLKYTLNKIKEKIMKVQNLNTNYQKSSSQKINNRTKFGAIPFVKAGQGNILIVPNESTFLIEQAFKLLRFLGSTKLTITNPHGQKFTMRSFNRQADISQQISKVLSGEGTSVVLSSHKPRELKNSSSVTDAVQEWTNAHRREI